MAKYDFGGWATRNDLQCSDGRIIRRDAFKGQNGAEVPLIWMHNHSDMKAVVGKAVLENRDEGVYAYCSFNETEEGKRGRELVRHGDVSSLSICAGSLNQNGNEVLHGQIREVSLVLAGANPGAFIDNVVEHGADGDDIVEIGYDERIMLYHSDDESKEKETTKVEDSKTDDEKKDNANDETDAATDLDVEKIFNDMSDEQKAAVYAIVGSVVDNDTENSEGGNEEMRHNIFEGNNGRQDNVLMHADVQAEILNTAKSPAVGSFQVALKNYVEDHSNELQHGAAEPKAVSGFVQDPLVEGNISSLFPEYKELRPGAPELLANDISWAQAVLAKVYKVPFNRIRTTTVDIRYIDGLRAKGYKKGMEKTLADNYKTARRTTDPQTVYVKSALNRDDIQDIDNFDIVKFQYDMDRNNLIEELATAIVFGDGRDDSDEDKISAEHIRPIVSDSDVYTKKVTFDYNGFKKRLQGTGTATSFGDSFIFTEGLIETVTNARIDLRGTGTPDALISPYVLTKMLLARDMNGRRIYETEAQIATALGVKNLYKVEKMNAADMPGLVIVNFADYALGANKGGDVTSFNDFDIDFNQYKSLLETRKSGALHRILSALVVNLDAGAKESVTFSAGTNATYGDNNFGYDAAARSKKVAEGMKPATSAGTSPSSESH